MNIENSIVPINKTVNEEKYEVDNIKNLICNIRGKQVILDSDIANLYEVETKRLNEAVKRNIRRFPEEFCFQLNEEEVDNLRSQIATSSLKRNSYGGRRYLPYAFTEQGIAMLSAVLHSDKAIEVSINVINAFVEIRKFISTNGQIFERLTKVEFKLLDYDKKFDEVFNQLQYDKKIKQKIFFDGQIYDAFSLFIDIIRRAEKEIILIDNYIDIETLNILSKKNSNVNVQVYTKSNTRLSSRDINKFNSLYPKLEIKFTNVFHDRFLILDKKIIYHIGASIKDAGKKCFGITLIKYDAILKDILGKL